MKYMLRKVLLLAFTLLIIVSIPLNVQAADDITGNTHEKDIRKMMDLGIMNGYGNGVFKPGNPMTRAQFATIIARALELPEVDRPSHFIDVDDTHGSKNYMMAAAEAGIITGYQGYFKPNDKISRQHMAVMMSRALTYKGIKEYTANLTFTDRHKINADYHIAVGTTVYYGIFQGDGELFNPLNNATRGQGAAVVSRFLEVVATGLPVLPPPPPVLEYQVATVSNSGQPTIINSYKTYAEAEKAATSNQVIMYRNDILKMAGGIGYSQAAFGVNTANIYTNQNLTTAFTYTPADYELEYVSSTEQYVQVKFAGKVGYMRHENIQLIPWNAIKGRSYYTASNGDLVHAIYSNKTNKYATYIAGKAPSFMASNVKYYSWDGMTFSDANSKYVGQAHQYFQYLPARSKTNYTAEEIDAYIMQQLKAIESPTGTYQDATTKSKLIGLGETLKEVEAEHKVNAMLILSLAQHESAYGMSIRAQNHNNLFGLRVFDTNPDDIEYASVEANIDSLIQNYFNKNYIPPTAPYAYGAAFGNKAQGFNVKYASDPFWGSKAAGHWYRADKLMGGKDMKNAHQIALTNTTGLNVRAGASTSHQKLYTYQYSQMPVIILEDVANSPWKKILSDDLNYDEVFVHGDYLTPLNTVR